jgi:AcrR family transcriptional regulator
MVTVPISRESAPQRERGGLPTRAERTLDALEEIFLREGFRRISVGDLAARLHCSRRTLYELASTKEDLFLLVVDSFLRRIRRRGDEEIRTQSEPASRIERYLAPGISESARASNLFFADVAGLPAAKRMLDEHQRMRMAGLREIIGDGAHHGIFRGFDAHLVAEVFSSAYRRVSQPDFLASANLSITEAYAELSRLLRHGLLHPDGRRDAGRRRPRGRRITRRAQRRTT